MMNSIQMYEFFELKESIENFISNRPDLHLMISHLSDENNVQNQENIDEEKEKIISKNLDFCLEHGKLSKLSVSSLNRIFNHPEKVLHNHHLLYKFIKQRIEERVKEIKTSKTQNEDENNLFILINSLDYNEMSEDEIIEIIDFSEKNFELPFFYPNNSQKVIKSIIQSNKDKDDEIKNIKNELLLQKQNQEQQTQILNEFKTHLSKLEEKYEQIVQQNEQMKNALLDQQTKNENKHNEIDKRLDLIEQNKKKTMKIIEENQKSKDQLIKNKQMKVEYVNDELDGIINHLKKERGENLIENGELVLSAGHQCDGSLSNLIKYDKEHINNYFQNNDRCRLNESEGWIEFDFVNRKINLTSYTLRTWKYEVYDPKTWRVIGSNDKKAWDVLNTQTNNPVLNHECTQHRFICESNNNYYRYIRYIQNDSWYKEREFCICLTCIEFFGSILSQ